MWMKLLLARCSILTLSSLPHRSPSIWYKISPETADKEERADDHIISPDGMFMCTYRCSQSFPRPCELRYLLSLFFPIPSSSPAPNANPFPIASTSTPRT